MDFFMAVLLHEIPIFMLVLNQACTGACMPGFLKLFLCRHLYVYVCVCVCVCVCLPPRILITSGMIWTPYGWLNNLLCVVQILSRVHIVNSCFYVTTVVSRCGPSIDACCENQSNQYKLALYKQAINSCTLTVV